MKDPDFKKALEVLREIQRDKSANLADSKVIDLFKAIGYSAKRCSLITCGDGTGLIGRDCIRCHGAGFEFRKL